MNHAKRRLSLLAGFALSTLLVTVARNAAAWTEHALGGCATSIGGTNGSAWITGCTGGTGGDSIYERQNGRWVQFHGLGTEISSDGSGGLGLVNAQGNIYFGSLNGSNLTWNQVTGCATSIAVTSDQNIQALITDCTPETGGFEIKYYTPGLQDPWTLLPGAAVTGAVNSSGDMWVVNSNHNIYEWNPSTSSWLETNGLATSIAVDSNGNVWVVGTNGALFVSTTHGATWTQESTTVSSHVTVDAAGNPWRIDSTGAPFSWSNP